MRIWSLIFFVLITPSLLAQKVHRVDPPHWFTGMNHPVLQLLLIGEELAQVTAEVDYPGVTVKAFDALPGNSSYALLYLEVTDQAQPGELTITIRGKRKAKIKYELQRRAVYEPKGLTAADVVYQLWVDGFINGDTTNDVAATLGGDLKGVKQHLDDITSLGFTCFSLSPVSATYDSLCQPQIQDHYELQSNYGSLGALVDLQEYAHRKQVKSMRHEHLNNVHSDHLLAKNPPLKDWIHHPGAGHYDSTGYLESNHYESTLFDPHASFIDRDQFITGWKAPELVDLNHTNDTVAEYLIQQSVWWQEAAGYDAVLLADYADIDQIFLRIWRDRMLLEFPSLVVVGDVHAEETAAQAWFLGESGLNKEYSSHLESVTDHTLQNAIHEFVLEKDGERIYRTVSTDFLYPNANQLLTFLDSWETQRWMSLCSGNLEKFKMGVGLLATLRGIPVMSYGTEIGLKKNEHMPGREPIDTLSAFIETSLDSLQVEVRSYVNKLLQWRRKNEPIKEGRFIQFTPQNGVYTFVRDTERQAVLVVVNPSDEIQTVSTRRFTEVTNGYHTAIEVISGQSYSVFDTWELQPWETRILELKRNPTLFEE